MLKGPDVQFICLLAYIFIDNNMVKNIGPDGDSAYFSATGIIPITAVFSYRRATFSSYRREK